MSDTMTAKPVVSVAAEGAGATALLTTDAIAERTLDLIAAAGKDYSEEAYSHYKTIAKAEALELKRAGLLTPAQEMARELTVMAARHYERWRRAAVLRGSCGGSCGRPCGRP
jgi:hypothetical protein